MFLRSIFDIFEDTDNKEIGLVVIRSSSFAGYAFTVDPIREVTVV